MCAGIRTVLAAIWGVFAAMRTGLAAISGVLAGIRSVLVGIWRMLTAKSASIWRGARAREHHLYRRRHHPSPRHW